MPRTEPSIVDPRTLAEIREFGNCHVIPACFAISALTVRLDRDVDSELGALCDAQLPRYFATLLLQRLEGKLALDAGRLHCESLSIRRAALTLLDQWRGRLVSRRPQPARTLAPDRDLPHPSGPD